MRRRLAWMACAVLAGICLGCSSRPVGGVASAAGGTQQRHSEGGSAAGADDNVGGGDGRAGAGCASGARRTDDISVANTFGLLAGALELPEGCGPFPTLLILAGSGPIDRDGNSVDGTGVDTLKLLANALAERGIASVRYDKAGIAASVKAAPAREQDLTFDMYVDDAERWVTAMRSDPRIGDVSIAGHSEGALVGMLAARRVAPKTYISLAGAGRPVDVVLREQLARQITDPALLAKIDHVLAELSAGRSVAVDDLPASLANLFRPSVQPYLSSWMKHDPAQELAILSAPTLLVQGTTDTQVSVEDAQLLARAKPDATLVIVEEMMHELKHATSDKASQQLAYTDRSLPIVPEVIDQCVKLVVQP